MRNQGFFFVVAASVVLSGCGGSSDDNASAPPPTQGPAVLSCASGLTAITAVQGEGLSSPLVGDMVDVRGVVHANFPGSNGLGGFFIQATAEEFDDNANASQGLFIHSPSANTIEVGQVVAVRGRVAEVNDQTRLTGVEDIEVCANSGTIVYSELNLPVADALDFERLENMAVRIPQRLYVTSTHTLARFGEVQLASQMLWQPTEFLEPGAEANTYAERYALKRILLDDGSSVQNPTEVPYPAPELTYDNTLRLGDTVAALEGAFTQLHGDYRLHPTVTPEFQVENPRTNTPNLPGEGDLRIASVNLWDYFPSELDDFERQRPKVVSVMLQLDADVYGVQELWNDGFGPDSAVADLIDALNEAVAGSPFSYVTFSEHGAIGAANITNGLIYRNDRVTQVGDAAYLDSDSFAFQTHRPPVAQTFQHAASEVTFTVVSNHIRSRRCGGTAFRFLDQGDGQDCASVARREAIEDTLPWLAATPTGVADAPVVLVGDFNSYRLEDPARLITEAGFVNAADLSEKDAYSYSFQGMLGSLDYVFVDERIVDAVTGVVHWRINADEPTALGFQTQFKSSRQVDLWYGESQFRASDHNPVIIELNTQWMAL